MACSTFRSREDGVVESVLILETGLGGGRSETKEAAAGRNAGYVMAVATSVSVTDERELALLALDFACDFRPDFALDLELASAESFDFFSALLLFSLVSLLVSSAAFIDFLVKSEAWDCP